MEQTEMIKVLWVDDNKQLLQQLPREAYPKGILLDPYECWEEAERALLANFDDYDAIILDAKCKFKKNEGAKAQRFLTNALSSINTICGNRSHQIHWYVLSMGGGEVGDINDSIPDTRKIWDGDWETHELNKDHRPYYLKTNDEQLALFERIKRQISQSNRTIIRTTLYHDVFRAIDVCHLNPDAASLLEDLLLPIHFPETKGVSEKHLTYAVRKIIEYIFRAMIQEWHLLPDGLLVKNKVNLFNSSLIIKGTDVREGGKNGRIILKAAGKIMDVIAGNNIGNMVTSVGDFVHTMGEEDTKLAPNMLEHFKITANTPYLLRSYALQLCDLLMQLEDIVSKYPDPEKNQQVWLNLQEQQ
jgi:hypothetical protein